MITQFKSKFIVNERAHKKEAYNLKNKVCQKKFKEYTGNTNMLSSVLNSDEDMNILTKRLIKKINGCISMNSKRVRISHFKKSHKDKLYEKLNIMKANNSSQKHIEGDMEEIAIIQDEEYKKVFSELVKTKDGEKLDSQKFWKLRKRMCPESKDPPSLKKEP